MKICINIGILETASFRKLSVFIGLLWYKTGLGSCFSSSSFISHFVLVMGESIVNADVMQKIIVRL